MTKNRPRRIRRGLILRRQKLRIRLIAALLILIFGFVISDIVYQFV